MGALKNYLLRLEERCSEHLFGQDAIRHAILSGFIKLSYDLAEDERRIGLTYDVICESYREFLSQTEEHAALHAA